jgi:hypothetical protein
VRRGGTFGQIFSGVDPFTEDPAPVKKGKKKRPKRPRVTIAHSPRPDLQFRPGGVKVLFRFFARNRVQVNGFICKLDKRPRKPCYSPKTYKHVGAGKHVFRVRAVGSTGLKGPVEIARFTIHKKWPPPSWGVSLAR